VLSLRERAGERLESRPGGGNGRRGALRSGDGGRPSGPAEVKLRTRVKVCCITDPEALALAVRYGADALGLVGPMPSGTGIIALETARRLAAMTPPPVASFLLSSAVEPEALLEEARAVQPTVLQIVDRVPDAAYRLLRRELPALKLVQAVHVGGEDALEEAKAAAELADAVLLDSGTREGPVAKLGGTGMVHDWGVSRRIVAAIAKPVILAGGLRPDNIAEAIRTVRPSGVDVASGVECAPGRKDPEKVRRFVDRAREAAARLGGRPEPP
jgi:phosphoribosylanthranilate isomerase